MTQEQDKILNFVSQDGDVFILGDFDDSITVNVIPNIVKLIDEKVDKVDPTLVFYINSYGGEAKHLYSLMTLIAMAKARGITIITVNMGYAYSCGSMLSILGDKRYMYKYAQNLMHLGCQGDDVSTFKQIERVSKAWQEHFENIVDVYKKHTKMSEEQIRKELSDDSKFLNAEECIKYGLADEIIDEPTFNIPKETKTKRRK